METSNFRTRNKVLFKSGILVGLIILLLIPTFFISDLISEREQRQEEAINEVSEKWAGRQTLSGPIITIPYNEYFKDSSKILRKRVNYIHILPEKLKINTQLFPEMRYRGIFEIVVYNSKTHFSGSFNLAEAKAISIPKQDVLLSEAFISLGISDLRGVEEQIPLKSINGIFNFNSGIRTNDILETAISTKIDLALHDSVASFFDFAFDVKLKGSQNLYFTPIGKVTEVFAKSSWNSPSFEGSFLPDERKIENSGFTAFWKILHLNRSYPQLWTNNMYSIGESSFGIELLLPIDNYKKTSRSIKYAVLFIALTFMIYFFLELLNNKLVHPFQYLLIGFGLCMFYTLLLSISEHLSYNWAYIISSFMTILLLGVYSNSILDDRKLAILIAATLTILYGFIFSIIQLQDYALLMGSIGLFIILALTMYYSKKIDWNTLGK